MVQKQKITVFVCGNLWTVAISTDFMSARMWEMISHILILWQPTMCYVLVGHNTPSSIIAFKAELSFKMVQK